MGGELLRSMISQRSGFGGRDQGSALRENNLGDNRQAGIDDIDHQDQQDQNDNDQNFDDDDTYDDDAEFD
jgi:hypothetical protein